MYIKKSKKKIFYRQSAKKERRKTSFLKICKYLRNILDIHIKLTIFLKIW